MRFSVTIHKDLNSDVKGMINFILSNLFMKKVFSCSLLLCISATVFSQVVATDKSGKIISAITQDESAKPMNPEDYADINGTPFLSVAWGKGMLQLNNGTRLTDVDIQFNLVNNELYYKKDQSTIVIANNVLEFVISFQEKGKIEMQYYRSGYPLFEQKTNKTFYRVLAKGKNFHFLCFDYKTIEDTYTATVNHPAKSSFNVGFKYFVYDVRNNRLRSIQMNQESLEKALPEMEIAIQQYIRLHNIKLHSEEEMIDLIKDLNQ